jgi:hypothetical protein
LRGPPDEKSAPPAKEGAPKIKPKERNKQAEHKGLPEAWQPLPQGGMNGLPMSRKEVDDFAWSAYNAMLTDPDGQKCVEDLLKVAFAPDVLLGAAFMAGVTCVLTNPANFRTGNSPIPPAPGHRQ